MSAVAAAPSRRRPADVKKGTLARITRRWPVESTFLFLIALIGYLALADYLVIHLHYLNGDAYARVANATYVLSSRDPHLGAIGFIWQPLPTLLDLPIVALQNWFPFVVTRGFAGSVEAALFGAGTVVLINLSLRRAGVVLPIRWLLLLVWIANPMIALYSAQGMSEGPFVFFVIASFMCFIRWTDTRRSGDLALLGVVVGLGTLVRIEFVLIALIVGAGIGFCSLGRKVGWRQLETQLLLYFLPVTFLFGLWIGATWVIEKDPLYFQHSVYSGQGAATGGFGARTVADFSQWSTVISYIGSEFLLLFPAVLVLVAAVAIRVVIAKDRRPAIVLLVLGAPVPLIDIYLLHANELALVLRYQIFVIPYTMVLALFLLKEYRRVNPRLVSLGALVLVVVLGFSNLSSFDLMSNRVRAREEFAALTAVKTNVSAGTVDPSLDIYDNSDVVARAVAAADTDHGLIAMDTFSGFGVFLASTDRTKFVVTSDEDFEAIVNQPLVYHVEYFLVPAPVGEGSLDHLNRLYPFLWANGSGFATLVETIGTTGWKLYKVIGPTGRG